MNVSLSQTDIKRMLADKKILKLKLFTNLIILNSNEVQDVG